MEDHTKEVYFHKYCSRCEHNYEKVEQTNSDGTYTIILTEECHDCMNHPYNYDSHKPVNFKEKD